MPNQPIQPDRANPRTPEFRPTHVVPPHGMPAWEAPDLATPTASLDPLLPVQLVERHGDWGHIRCANGWAAWVDGRHLVALPQDPPTADAAPATTADPRPLLAGVEEAVADYRSAVEELAGGGLDGESFRDRTRELRIGLVVDGESMWVYDPEEGRWLYGDGRLLATYATDRAAAGEEAGRAPARFTAPEGES
ncbi:hypothetical protein J2Z21_000316 [Streptomyces griseochromogenes]|uniref:Uncharacterized protein n=1 Tax=Streptomyces griseochromogenes TaxID=68214 RepID=A0A1B1B1U5_9ACTN|nr:hypothetical protein [Streptomyces griseochromogenes]ANP52780.1 hypothetical protein AVL59_27460 [Streptomyces griseochromogenes]MBP2047394.1 hypothetical protein [Streptomyces griseochromogenes]